MNKNPGRVLTDKLRGMLEALPAWVRATVTLVRTKQPGIEPTVDPPVLSTGIVESAAMQEVIDERNHVVTSLDPAELPKTRTGLTVLPNGQVATVTEVADDSVQTIVSSSVLVDGETEAIGGVFLKREVVAPSVFPSKLFSKERPEVAPERFRAAVPLKTERTDSAGTAAEPTLGVGEVARSSEQTRVDVKRDTIASRSLAGSLPITLSGEQVLPNQQLATVAETLANGTQTIVPGALVVDGEVAQLGDGTSLKRVVTAPSVFGAKVFSLERPETIPVAFRAAVPLETTREDSAGTAAVPILGANDIEKVEEQVTEYVRRLTTRTRTLPGSFPTITLRSFDNDLQSEVFVELNVVTMGSAFTPSDGTIDYEESEISDVYSLRRVYRLPNSAGPGTPVVPLGYTTREPGSFDFPGLVTGITVAAIAIAPTASAEPRSEVNWQPVWRPGFTMDVNFIVETTFFLAEPAPDPQFVIRTNDIVFKGVSFQVSIPKVLNNALSNVGVTFSGDALYGNLSENFSVAASVPSASGYVVGSTQVVASKVTPWRRLWVKRTTKLVLL